MTEWLNWTELKWTSILAWRIPWTEAPGGLRVIHDWATFAFTLVLLQSVGSDRKHLPTMREAWVRGLGQEYPLEKEMAIYSSTLAWKIPCTEEPGRLQPKGSQRVGHDQATSLSPCLVLQKNSKIVLCESLEVEPGPCPKAILLFLDCPSLVSSSPSLTSNCLNLPFRTHRRSSEVAPIRYK